MSETSRARKVGRAIRNATVRSSTAILGGVMAVAPHWAGAVDIMVVRQPDGSLKSSPFYVRFGKYQSFASKQRSIAIYINGELAPFRMNLGGHGQAFFAVDEDGAADAIEASVRTEGDVSDSGIAAVYRNESFDAQPSDRGAVHAASGSPRAGAAQQAAQERSASARSSDEAAADDSSNGAAMGASAGVGGSGSAAGAPQSPCAQSRHGPRSPSRPESAKLMEVLWQEIDRLAEADDEAAPQASTQSPGSDSARPRGPPRAARHPSATDLQAIDVEDDPSEEMSKQSMHGAIDLAASPSSHDAIDIAGRSTADECPELAPSPMGCSPSAGFPPGFFAPSASHNFDAHRMIMGFSPPASIHGGSPPATPLRTLSPSPIFTRENTSTSELPSSPRATQQQQRAAGPGTTMADDERADATACASSSSAAWGGDMLAPPAQDLAPIRVDAMEPSADPVASGADAHAVESTPSPTSDTPGAAPGTSVSPSPIPDLRTLDISLCVSSLNASMTPQEVATVFDGALVDAATFVSDPAELLAHPELACRVGNLVIPWAHALPAIVATQVFGIPADTLAPPAVSFPYERLPGRTSSLTENDSWRLWPFGADGGPALEEVEGDVGALEPGTAGAASADAAGVDGDSSAPQRRPRLRTRWRSKHRKVSAPSSKAHPATTGRMHSHTTHAGAASAGAGATATCARSATANAVAHDLDPAPAAARSSKSWTASTGAAVNMRSPPVRAATADLVLARRRSLRQRMMHKMKKFSSWTRSAAMSRSKSTVSLSRLRGASSTRSLRSMLRGPSSTSSLLLRLRGASSKSRRESTHRKKKSLVPPLDLLALCPLRPGRNTIRFEHGSSAVEAVAFVLNWDARLVISDVDGTITRSDALGHVLPRLGYDWSHAGIAPLFADVAANGYSLMYLSSRAIAQAATTRNYLDSLDQQGTKMPPGPVIISPDGLLPSLYREMIIKRPHEFKIGTLQDIRALFPPECNPFYAGFGNRDTDERSYLEVGVNANRIFIINPKGQIRRVGNAPHFDSLGSLPAINTLVHQLFPPVQCLGAPAPAALPRMERASTAPPMSPHVPHAPAASPAAAAPLVENEAYRDIHFWKDPLVFDLDPELMDGSKQAADGSDLIRTAAAPEKSESAPLVTEQTSTSAAAAGTAPPAAAASASGDEEPTDDAQATAPQAGRTPDDRTRPSGHVDIVGTAASPAKPRDLQLAPGIRA